MPFVPPNDLDTDSVGRSHNERPDMRPHRVVQITYVLWRKSFSLDSPDSCEWHRFRASFDAVCEPMLSMADSRLITRPS